MVENRYPSDLGTVEYPIAVGGYKLYVHVIPQNITGYGYDKCYVGITGNKNYMSRWYSGYGKQVFGFAIKKYGKNNIIHQLIFANLLLIDANILEAIMIKAMHSHVSEKGYNVAWGGQGSPGVSPVNKIDMTGMRVGRLTVCNSLDQKYDQKGHTRTYWRCLCDCGNYCTCTQDNLVQYIKKGYGSCGCMNKRIKGNKSPNSYEFVDDYVIGHCNNGKTFKIDCDDYEKIKHRTWTIEPKFQHVFASKTYKYQRQRIESIILDVPTHNIDKLRLKYKNGDPTDVRKSNLIIYYPECDNPFEYNYFINHIVANGIRFDHGNIWCVGRKGEKKHSVIGLENALKEYEERYGNDFLSDYLEYKNVRDVYELD